MPVKTGIQCRETTLDSGSRATRPLPGMTVLFYELTIQDTSAATWRI